MTAHLFVLAYVGAVGLIVGSYLNVVIHRLPRRESTVLPFSRCPQCGTKIRPVDNIPVLSYLLLWGRCRTCKAPISWRYPFVELTTAALFVGSVATFGAGLHGLVATIFSALLVALAGIDLEHFILPDVLTLSGTAAALAASPWLPWIRWQDALIGAIAGGGSLWLLSWLWLVVKKQEGMGLGDAKMLAMIGAFLGWQGAIVAVFFASLTGAVIGLALIGVGRGHLQTRLPFGVFLSAGGVVALLAGPQIVSAYLGLF